VTRGEGAESLVAQAVRTQGGAQTAGFAALLLSVGAATVVAAVALPQLGLVVLPVFLVAILYVMARAPLRVSAAALLFLVLSLEISTDAAGVWHTPLAAVGDLLQDNLERSAHLPGIPLSGLELLALYLLAVAALRREEGGPPRQGTVRTPRVVSGFLALYVAGVLYAEVNGLARGAPLASWKLHNLFQVPLFAALFLTAFRGPRDHRLLGPVVVVAASVKALLALYVQRVAAPELTGGKLAYATNHGDSVLFAVAAVILIGAMLERRDPRRFLVLAPLLGLVLIGMHENNRRTAWLILELSIVVAYLVSPPRPWKRAVTRIGIAAAPLLALYLAVGWNRNGAVFAPIQAFRSVDATVDNSTRWRDIENWNIAMSMREHPILGIGLGGEYSEFLRGDDISSVFAEYRAWPHNSVLALLLFAGPFGFTAMWALAALAVFLAVRSHRFATEPDDRVAALACVAAVIACGVLAFADTGAHFVHYRVLLAVAVAVSGKLAVATGAWPSRTTARPARAGVGVASPGS
jgi:hypothetical protein